MAKNFTILTILLLSLISPAAAQDSGKEREKLIQLVLQLETEFGKTLMDYRLLQQEYAKLLERPKVPNQKKKVEQLQKLLDESAKKIHQHQRLEADAKKGAKAKDAEMAAIRRNVGNELKKLRKSLKEEQAALAVAQVKLSQLKALEDRSKALEKLYREETVGRSKMMAELKVLRGEKNILVARVDEFMKRATVAEAAQIKSAERIGQLEEQAGAIKIQMAERDAEIKRLKEDIVGGGAMMAELQKAKKEQEKLNGLLKSRKAEMGKLQTELAAAEKKALDLPVLIKARNDLQGQLTKVEQEQKKLLAERAGLLKEFTQSKRTLEGTQKKVAQLEGELAKSMQEAALADKLSRENKALLAQRDDFVKKLELASKEMLVAKKEQEQLKAELKKNADLAMAAKKLGDTNKKLLAERDGLKNELAKATTEFKKLQASTKSMQGDLAKAEELAATAAKLGKENKDLEVRRSAMSKELEAGKAAMAALEKKVKSLEGEMARNKDSVMAANKLGAAQKKLVAERDGLKRDLGNAMTELAVLKNGSKAMLNELNKATTLAAKSAKLGKENQELTAKRDALSKEVAAGNTAMATLEEKVKSLQAELAKNKDATMAANKLVQEKSALAADLEKMKKTFGSAQTALKEKDAKLAESMKLAASAAKLEAERDQLNKELAQMRAGAQAMEADLAKATQLAATAAKLGKENKELVARRDDLSQEVASGKKAMTDLEKKVGSLQADLDKTKELAMAADKLSKEKSALAAALKEKEVKLAESMKLAASAAKLEAERDQLNKELAQMRTGAQAMETNLAKATQLAATAAKLGKENKELVVRREDLIAEVADGKKIIGALEKRLLSMDEALGKSRAAAMAADKLAKEKEALAADLETMKKDFGGARNSLKAMNIKVAESAKLAENAKKLSKELEDAKARLATAEKAMKAAEAKTAENQKLVDASKKLGKENAELAARSKQLDTELKAAKAALAKAKTDMTASQSDVARKMKLAESATRLTEERNKLQKDLSSTKSLLAEAQLKSKNAAELAAEAQQLKKDYTVVSARVEALEKDKERLNTEVSKKDADLKKVRAEMSVQPDQSAALAKLESEKEKLNDELATKSEDLKKVRMDLGRLHLSNASMEKQLNQFRRRLATIDPIRYAKGAADVKDQQTRVLTQVREVMMLFPNARFEIVGHTCDLGNKAGNLRLSRERARALFDFLVDEGIPVERLKSIGMGDSQPAVPNTNETNRRQNRRVEVVILD